MKKNYLSSPAPVQVKPIVNEKFVLHLPLSPLRRAKIDAEFESRAQLSCPAGHSYSDTGGPIDTSRVTAMHSSSSLSCSSIESQPPPAPSDTIATTELKPSDYCLTQKGLHQPVWPKQVSIHCLWDSHPFQTIPIGIPIKKNADGTHTTVGCYCSFACAAAANLADNRVSSTIRNERHAVICMIARTMGIPDLKVAPDRESLRIFGGQLGIEQFRTTDAGNVTMLYPPFRPYSIFQKTDEADTCHGTAKHARTRSWDVDINTFIAPDTSTETGAKTKKGLGKCMNVSFDD